MDGQAPLQFEGVSKHYKTHFWQRPVTSLDRLTLEVRAGEILGLLGPNGAGKTTAIKLALGLIFPDSGSVALQGRPPSAPASRRGTGYLPESPYFPDDLTGLELVEFAGRLQGVPGAGLRDQALALLRLVGLEAVADRKLRKYSKGMVQRAGMARALIGRPRFVILDEPMSGLDPVGRREFRDLILSLKRQGTTVLFSSHVLSDAEMLCDRVAILKEGRLRATESVSELSESRRVRAWEVEVRGGGKIDGAELVAERGDGRLWRFPATLEAEAVLAAVRAAGAHPVMLTPQRETLEDLFLRTLSEATP